MPGDHAMFSSLSRAFAVGVCVTLAAGLRASEPNLNTPSPDDAAVKTTVAANSAFAIDLYKQLSRENEGKSLFFSPYSISSALTMAVEGARGQTALEMGRVLRYPDAAQRKGEDAQLLPWDTSRIHRGYAVLSGSLRSDPKGDAVRAEIESLRKKLAQMNQATRAVGDWKRQQKLAAEAQKVADQINTLLGTIKHYQFTVANALWGEKTYPFAPAYLNTINQHYTVGGGMFPVDFKNDFEPERLNINRWVEKQTNDRIKDLLPNGSLDKDTRLVLTNAIYFKGDWSVPFNEQDTKELNFTLAGGQKKQVPMMHAPHLGVGRYGAFNAEGSFFDTPMRIRHGQNPNELYPKADGFAIIELPYRGDDLSMVVIAPNDPADLPAIEKMLAPEKLGQWIGQLKQRDTSVHLPKFKTETDYDLGASLQNMGMVRAFINPNDPKAGAQFQGMTTTTDPNEQLYITKVIHKAFVEVNEKGTEAAAATGVAMAAATAVPLDRPFIPQFKADRPFVFLIRDTRTGAVLFLGRMMEPAAAAGEKTGDPLSRGMKTLFGDKEAMNVVAKPTKVQAYRLADDSFTKPTVKDFKMKYGPVAVDDALAKSMSQLLLDDKSYKWNTGKNCDPSFGVRLEFIQGDKTTDVLICFDCDILGVYVNGKSVGEADFDNVHTPFAKLVKRMFPKDQEIQDLKE
jgi:serine protease inhibitor